MDHFSGSYKKEDVNFLLKPITIASTSIEDKESLIQSNVSHYSEFFTFEKEPSKIYMDFFWKSVEQNAELMARHCLILASQIRRQMQEQNMDDIALVSLVRAGTPIGVILKRIIDELFNCKVSHYSVSIIRDRGIDHNAMNKILETHDESNIFFIDGWTGKGVIARVLEDSIADYNKIYNRNVNHNLYVLSDLAGTAFMAATADDYLIPSSILNSTVSGLISRSILNDNYIGENDYHGCVYYKEYESIDNSQSFVDKIMELAYDSHISLNMNNVDTQKIHETILSWCTWSVSNKQVLQKASLGLLEIMKERHNIDDINFIKPGIGEATRVLLRRIPECLWIRNENDASVQHLIALANEKNITIKVDHYLPYFAVAIIKEKN